MRKGITGIMKIVYVCSPYKGDIGENVKYAQKCCREIVNNNNIPIAPHLFFPQFMNEETERKMALEMNKRFIDVCDVVYVFGSNISEGMKFELDYAKSIGKEVVYFPNGQINLDYGENNEYL